MPYHHTIPDADKQRDFFEKQLEPELEGILAWAVEGAMEWNQVGLDEPQIVKVATQEYRGEMDVIGQFLAEQCVVDPRFEIDTTELYLAYTSWWSEPITQDQWSSTSMRNDSGRRTRWVERSPDSNAGVPGCTALR